MAKSELSKILELDPKTHMALKHEKFRQIVDELNSLRQENYLLKHELEQIKSQNPFGATL